jgi:hypothetical protein
MVVMGIVDQSFCKKHTECHPYVEDSQTDMVIDGDGDGDDAASKQALLHGSISLFCGLWKQFQI